MRRFLAAALLLVFCCFTWYGLQPDALMRASVFRIAVPEETPSPSPPAGEERLSVPAETEAPAASPQSAPESAPRPMPKPAHLSRPMVTPEPSALPESSPDPFAEPEPSPEETLVLTGLYYIKVNVTANTVTVYTKGDSGEYDVPIKAMICSTGSDTPRSGIFKPGWRLEWQNLFYGVFGQYVTQITGNILFHSVPYQVKFDKNSLEYWDFDKLGTAASAGCVRLQVIDAKWIFDRFPDISAVEFYEDPDPGPLGKPTAPKISADELRRGWDPSDPDPGNFWNMTEEEIYERYPWLDPDYVPPPMPEPIPEPDPTPTPSPEPTPEPSPEPTPEPTPEPSPEPTPEPTPEPGPEPTPEPTPEPEPDPTPEPEPEPLPGPDPEPEP